MKDLFQNYKTPTESEFKKMWKEAIFVPDANVLLDLYRLPPNTSKALIKTFKKLGQNLWIPHQVAKDFYQNRVGVIISQLNVYEKLEKLLEQGKLEFEERIKKLDLHHPFILPTAVINSIDEGFEKVQLEIGELKKKHPDWSKEDTVLDEIEGLFEGKCGNPYDQENLNKYFVDAESRFIKHVPPGFEDDHKDYPNKYSDYIIWRQIIDIAKENNKPVIFITRDNKSDWWLEKAGKIIGPRYELCEEFTKETANKFYAYNSSRFLELADRYLGQSTTPAVKIELEDFIKSFEKENQTETVSPLTNRGAQVGTSGINIADLVGEFKAEEGTVSQSLSEFFRNENETKKDNNK